MWSADWSGFDLVYVFQRPESMERVLAKASRELRPGAWLASLEFEADSRRPAALVLAPTRELAEQIVDELRSIAQSRALKIAPVFFVGRFADAFPDPPVGMRLPGFAPDLGNRERAMQMETGSTTVRSAGPSSARGRPHPAAADDAAEFAAMRSAYHAAGGFARGDDLAGARGLRPRQPCTLGRRWCRRGVRLRVAAHPVVPMFQFTGDLALKPGLKAVLSELASEYDGRRLAEWFVEANGWLDDARPIDVLDSNPDEVLQAARADRFVATG